MADTHETFRDALMALTGKPHEVTVTPARAASADVSALAEEVVRILNTPGGPTLAARAVR